MLVKDKTSRRLRLHKRAVWSKLIYLVDGGQVQTKQILYGWNVHVAKSARNKKSHFMKLARRYISQLTTHLKPSKSRQKIQRDRKKRHQNPGDEFVIEKN